MRSISNQIRKITETNIVGFGANSRYLSELGIQTKRDGTLLINERSFKEPLKKIQVVMMQFLILQLHLVTVI